MESLLKFVLVAAFLTRCEAFCGDRKLNGDLSRAAVKAGEWLREQMGEDGVFPLGHSSAYAFHALRLVGYSVPKVSKLGAEHLKQEIEKIGLSSISGGRLALYILGVISSCEDPRDFNKRNLVAALKGKRSSYGSVGSFNHPFQLGLYVLALCTSGEKVDISDVRFLVEKLSISDYSVHNIDTLSLGTVALSCVKREQAKTNEEIFEMDGHVQCATYKLKAIQKLKDGAFGNEATTSLAVQALLAAGVKWEEWNCSATMKKLLAMQDKDGAFTNELGTIHALPALIGAVHYDVKDLSCPSKEPEEKEKMNITVCMKLEFEANLTSKVAPPAEYFIVENGTNAHSIMKLASTRHACYKFTTVLTSWGSSVESICGVSKNHTLKRYWSILIDPGRRSAPYGIDALKPRDGECLIFRYKQYHWK